MANLDKHKFSKDGFLIVNNIYTNEEINKIIDLINEADATNATFRKTEDLFAIRQFLKEIPDVLPLILNEKLKSAISSVTNTKYFIVKSIYFDKPKSSNWYVAYHQDLTISVNKKVCLENFGPWTVKQNQFSVQPPVEILEDIITVRIHLDETTNENGALKVISGSHLKKVYRFENIKKDSEVEASCEVDKGGIMLMKPLLMHSSGRTKNNSQRRVIHIEFSSKELPSEIEWSERININ